MVTPDYVCSQEIYHITVSVLQSALILGSTFFAPPVFADRCTDTLSNQSETDINVLVARCVAGRLACVAVVSSSTTSRRAVIDASKITPTRCMIAALHEN